MKPNSPQTIGKRMAFIAWIIGIILLTQIFGAWEAHEENPNQSPQSFAGDRKTEVLLKQNRQGHYRTSGAINGKQAEFMVDTGATDVVIPLDLAKHYGLTGTGQGLGLTANGYVELQRTMLNEIKIGEIKLYNVRASLNPGMAREQPILLGMNVLSKLELNQQQGTMSLTQHH